VARSVFVSFSPGQYGDRFLMSPDSKPALSAPPDPKMIEAGQEREQRTPLFPKSRLPVFTLLFAFGEII
jgi:hypothetical protein